MNKTTYAGIDYSGLTQVNRNPNTGIRYGIIPVPDVGQSWYDSSEPNDAPCACPECGNEMNHTKKRTAANEYWCRTCHKGYSSSDDIWGDSSGSHYQQDGIEAFDDDNNDLWIVKSPYFTHAQFCSPCAPGACYLRNEIEPTESNRAYCLNGEWFNGGKPPYRVWSVKTGKEIIYKDVENECHYCHGVGRDTIQRVAEVRNQPVEMVRPTLDHVKDLKPDDTFECWTCHGARKIKSVVEEEI